jgi:pfkB family carbohydrate kinase
VADPGAIVCFGEVLLRLSAPVGEMLLQTPAFEAAVGGAEANVAVALARAGAPAAMVTVLPNKSTRECSAACTPDNDATAELAATTHKPTVPPPAGSRLSLSVECPHRPRRVVVTP